MATTKHLRADGGDDGNISSCAMGVIVLSPCTRLALPVERALFPPQKVWTGKDPPTDPIG